jgi:hypothetical protein
MPTYIVISFTASFPRYRAGSRLIPSKNFSGGVTLTLTAQGQQAQCGQYTVALTGEDAAALDASQVSIVLRPKERQVGFLFYRKIESTSQGNDPCNSQPVEVISSTSTAAVNLASDNWASWGEVAVFGNGYGSKGNTCFASGATTESSKNNYLSCDPSSGSISVTIQDAY